MSVFGLHHINRHSVVPLERTDEQYARTVYPGELVWHTPPVTGGKLACRLISIDLEKKVCELEVTATGSNLYKRGERLTGIPFTRVFKRNLSSKYWPRPRFSLQWVDYPTAKERNGEQWPRLVALINSQAWNK